MERSVFLDYSLLLQLIDKHIWRERLISIFLKVCCLVICGYFCVIGFGITLAGLSAAIAFTILFYVVDSTIKRRKITLDYQFKDVYQALLRGEKEYDFINPSLERQIMLPPNFTNEERKQFKIDWKHAFLQIDNLLYYGYLFVAFLTFFIVVLIKYY